MNIDLEKLPGLIYCKDSADKLTDCNFEFANKLGYRKPSELIGLISEQLAIDSDSAQKIRQSDQLVLDSLTEATTEEIYQDINGDKLILAVSKKPLYDNQGALEGILCYCHDITSIRAEQKSDKLACEKAISANQAKSAFLAAMSHDLRTPLNAINGMAQILRTQNLVPTHAEFVHDILASCQVLRSLVEDILNLSKIESDKLEFIEEPLDLRFLVNEVISQLNFLAEQKNINLLLAYNEDVPRFLVGDSRRVRQILMNLIGNAIKFTNDGHILLAIEPIEVKPNEVEIQIAIEDNGMGIPPERVGNIFEKFYQVDTVQKYEGTGLGLSIVEHLVNKMGGRIQVNSQLEKGSTFWCNLHLKRQTDTKQRKRWETIANDFMILIVDNNLRRAEHIERLIGTDNIIHADHELSLTVLQNQNHNKPFLITLIHESILTYDEHFIDAFLLKNSGPVPKFAVYGQLTNNQRIPHKTIEEYFSTTVEDAELMGILLALHKKATADKKASTHLVFKQKEKPKILLVEDNPINQKVIRIMLNNQGCEIELANNGKKAIELALTNSHDLIFMDIGLPDTTGLEVTKKLITGEEFDKNTPIIALTGHVSEEDKKDCLDAGMSDFVVKPINEAELVGILAKYLT